MAVQKVKSEDNVSLMVAEKQNVILNIFIQLRQPLHLRDLMLRCDLTYQQVASALTALVSKGYVRRVRAGVYQVTEEARLLELSSEHQVKVLKRRVEELELLVKRLLTLS